MLGLKGERISSKTYNRITWPVAFNSVGLGEMKRMTEKTTSAPSRCCCQSGSSRGGRADKEIKVASTAGEETQESKEEQESREERFPEYSLTSLSQPDLLYFSWLVVFSVWSKILL